MRDIVAHIHYRIRRTLVQLVELPPCTEWIEGEFFEGDTGRANAKRMIRVPKMLPIATPYATEGSILFGFKRLTIFMVLYHLSPPTAD